MGILITAIVFGLVLGILIFVHELGHFLTARRNGITAHEFGFGFPPRIVGRVKDEKTGKWRIIWGNKEYHGNNTLYSLNWIPLGGFVRIKGESPVDMEGKKFEELSEEDQKFVKMSTDPDSFAVQPKWVRFRVLVAGVAMNFLLAWVLASIALMIGAPEPKEGVIHPEWIIADIGVQISEVKVDSPAEEIGLKVGDIVNQICYQSECTQIMNANQLKDTIYLYQGEEIAIHIARGRDNLVIVGVPRIDVEEGQGALGIAMGDMVLVKYPFFQAIWEGLMRVIGWTQMILQAFWTLISAPFTNATVDMESMAGPVGIAVLTKQMQDLGFVYLLQFMAVLSVNLGIINILPIPALDGGRIMFLIIEAIKGKPINPRVENIIHTVFFVALLALMAWITFADVMKYI